MVGVFKPADVFMDYELCVLFAYHKVDALTLYHLDLLKRHNPNYLVIPITDDVPEHLPDGVDVKDFPDPWPKVDPWRRCDTMLYRWFLNRKVSAKRYVYLEYDCLCTQDLAISYRDVWNAEVAARDLVTPGVPLWMWFQEADRYPAEDRAFIAGLSPLAGVFFSHDALERTVEHVIRADVFCELRIGTAAKKAGLTITTFPPELRANIQYNPHARVPTGKGIFHAVKSIKDIEPMAATENVALNRPATQSSVSEWSKGTAHEDAAGGNNGLIDGISGFHTAMETGPWWQVDCEVQCELNEIRLYNRRDCAERLRHFRIFISRDGMQWACVHEKTDDSVFGSDQIVPYSFSCSEGTVARYVRVQLIGTNYLHFSECEVRGKALSPA